GHANALLHLHHQHRIGENALEFRRHGHVADGPGIQGPATIGFPPAPALGATAGAHEARDVPPGFAVQAALEGQHALGTVLPELFVEVVLGPWRRVGNEFAKDHPLRIAKLTSPKSPQPVTTPSSSSGNWNSPTSSRRRRVPPP